MHDTDFFWKSLSPAHQLISTERVREAMHDPRWRRAVVLREPVERWMSAYQSKCMLNDHFGDHHCQRWLDLKLQNRSAVPSVRLVASRLRAKLDQDPAAQCDWNPHWRPQHCFCDLGHALNDSWTLRHTQILPFRSLSAGMRQLYSGRVAPARLEMLMNQTERLTIAPMNMLEGTHVTDGARGARTRLDEAMAAVIRSIYVADYEMLSRLGVAF